MSNQDKIPSPPPGAPEPKPSEAKPTESPRETLSLDVPGKNAGIACPKCGQINRPGVLICEKCGTLLLSDEKPAISTKRFDSEKQTNTLEEKNGALTETSELLNLAVNSAGSTQFGDNMVLRLEIEGAPTPILLHPKSETSIGRRDPATGTMPDVDLSAYAGYRLGVSRKHAVIRLKNKQLEIFDLGSSNGTSVNGVRLTAHQPHSLRDGDEILLGKMALRVLFQIRNRRK